MTNISVHQLEERLSEHIETCAVHYKFTAVHHPRITVMDIGVEFTTVHSVPSRYIAFTSTI
jgi:hypothetical protein